MLEARLRLRGQVFTVVHDGAAQRVLSVDGLTGWPWPGGGSPVASTLRELAALDRRPWLGARAWVELVATEVRCTWLGAVLPAGPERRALGELTGDGWPELRVVCTSGQVLVSCGTPVEMVLGLGRTLAWDALAEGEAARVRAVVEAYAGLRRCAAEDTRRLGSTDNVSTSSDVV